MLLAVLLLLGFLLIALSLSMLFGGRDTVEIDTTPPRNGNMHEHFTDPTWRQ